MELPVCNVLNVCITKSISLLSKLIKNEESHGLSNDVPIATTQVGLETPSPTPTTLLTVQRKTITEDGVFGELEINQKFVCYTVENKDRIIAEGLYDARLDLSPRLGYICPHIAVPDRDLAAGGDAGIRIHIANQPHQLEGCIAVGRELDNDSVDNSRAAFEAVMKVLPESFKILVRSIH